LFAVLVVLLNGAVIFSPSTPKKSEILAFAFKASYRSRASKTAGLEVSKLCFAISDSLVGGCVGLLVGRLFSGFWGAEKSLCAP